MNKFFAIAAAGAIAIVASLSTTAPSSAFDPGPGIAAGIFGFVAGVAIVSAAEHSGYYSDDYYDADAWDQHVLACEDAHPSYDEGTDTYINSFGHVRRCRL